VSDNSLIAELELGADHIVHAIARRRRGTRSEIRASAGEIE
jgi:hypothetical protein